LVDFAPKEEEEDLTKTASNDAKQDAANKAAQAAGLT